MDFRKRTIDNFAIVFNGSQSDNDGQSSTEEFAKKWNWFGVMHNLCNGEIVNLERITNLSLYECLTWLTYETDLNETKAVKI